MVEFEVRDWLDIIDVEIDSLKKEQYFFMSALGSSIIITLVLIWFTYVNFIQSHDILWDIMLPAILIQNLVFYTILIVRIISKITYHSTRRRIAAKLPIKSENSEIFHLIKKLKISAILMLLFIILFSFEFFIIENFTYYFITTTLIAFIVGLSAWIEVLLTNIMDSDITIYEKLKCDIILGRITNVNDIRNKYSVIKGEPSKMIILDEKSNFVEF